MDPRWDVLVAFSKGSFLLRLETRETDPRVGPGWVVSRLQELLTLFRLLNL